MTNLHPFSALFQRHHLSLPTFIAQSLLLRSSDIAGSDAPGEHTSKQSSSSTSVSMPCPALPCQCAIGPFRRNIARGSLSEHVTSGVLQRWPQVRPTGHSETDLHAIMDRTANRWQQDSAYLSALGDLGSPVSSSVLNIASTLHAPGHRWDDLFSLPIFLRAALAMT
jgi:hypothetical protein